MTIDVDTRTAPLPGSVKAFTVEIKDRYTIVINESLSYDQKMEAFRHEMDHIRKGDFFNEQAADLIEAAS